MAEVKNNVTGNEQSIDEKKEQQGTPDVPADNKDEKKDGVFKKIGNGFKKHGKKIGIGLGLAAAFAGGLAAEKFGLPAFGKKDPDQPEEQ